MPLYEYACQKCEKQFETLVFGDEPVECPGCHGTDLERLLSVPAAPRTESAGGGLPTACGEGPPCGAPWCQRK